MSAIESSVAQPKSLIKQVVGYINERHAWFFMIFVIPISLVYDLYLNVRTRLLALNKKAPLKHEENVRYIQRQVDRWRGADSGRLMCTARPAWKSISLQKMTYKSVMYGIQIDMHSIMAIDGEKRLVRVEPMVTIGQLNDYLIRLGWTLPVVPELDDLTIGGLVMGGGIESTSHKYGLFQYLCKRYELVLSDSSVIACSTSANVELFAAVPFSYGTLGFLTAVDISIIPYKPYIKLTYNPINSLQGIVDAFGEATNDPKVDSVEGIMYSIDAGVIMSGVFCDTCEPPTQLNKLAKWYKPWFYMHVSECLHGSRTARTEYVPTKDFYHRHNKSWFWLMKHIVSFANHPLFRYLLGWTMPPKYSLLKLLRSNLVPDEQTQNFVCQDFGFHLQGLKDALEFVDKETKMYPLWLCPTRYPVPKGMEHLSAMAKEDIHVDVGIYGFCTLGSGFDRASTQRRLERYAIDHKGYVALYAETELTREDFHEMFSFNLSIYDRVRQRYGCEGAFPHVYDKISKVARN